MYVCKYVCVCIYVYLRVCLPASLSLCHSASLPLCLSACLCVSIKIEQMVTHGINLSAVDDAGQDARAIVKAKFDEDISHILNSEAGGAEAKQLSSKENSE